MYLWAHQFPLRAWSLGIVMCMIVVLLCVVQPWEIFLGQLR
jgi:hypothetical protein